MSQCLDVAAPTNHERDQLIAFLRDFNCHTMLTIALRGQQFGFFILRVPTKNSQELLNFILANFLPAEDWGAIQYASLEEAESAPNFAPEQFNSNIRLDS